jgi:predicted pyridoxine 5'-phosphate oxidase superfamily flavin-nucleotide-binding protein
MGLARYHEGQRRLQDRFDSRRIADRLEQVTYSDALDDDDRAMIEGATMFFLATADADGRPDCSFKGGAPGFVKVLSPRELVFPDYDGNGQFRSLGNLLANPHAGMLFVDWTRPRRLRVNGRVTIGEPAEDPARWPGAQLVVRVEIEQVFPNCPRYLPRLEVVEPSPYLPDARGEAPRPGWKDNPSFCDALPERDRRP